MFNLVRLCVIEMVNLDRFVADVAEELFPFCIGLRDVVVEELLSRNELLVSLPSLFFETLEEFLVFFT